MADALRTPAALVNVVTDVVGVSACECVSSHLHAMVIGSTEVSRRGVPIRDVSSFQRVLCTGFNGVGT